MFIEKCSGERLRVEITFKRSLCLLPNIIDIIHFRNVIFSHQVFL